VDGWGLLTLSEEAAYLDRTLAEHRVVVSSFENQADRARIEAELGALKAKWAGPYEARRQAAIEVGLRQVGHDAVKAVKAVNIDTSDADAETYLSLVKACVTALKRRDGTGHEAFVENSYYTQDHKALYDVLCDGYRVAGKVPEHALDRGVHSSTIVGALRLLLSDLSPPLLSGVWNALGGSSAGQSGMDEKETVSIVSGIGISARRLRVLKEVLVLALDVMGKARADSTAIMRSLGSAMVFGNHNPIDLPAAHAGKVDRLVRALSVHANRVMYNVTEQLRK
jgi:hypothetical protein